MIQTRIVVRPTRSARDLKRRRRYTVVARFPGGREIAKGHAETRQRAFKKAQAANTPQTSPSAGAINYQNAAGPDDVYKVWKRVPDNDILIY